MAKQKRSIMVENMDCCMVCGAPYPHVHHVLGASNRKWSEKYRLVVPLCYTHHNGSDKGVHFDKTLDTALKIMAQKKFEETYPDLNFLEVFGKNYL